MTGVSHLKKYKILCLTVYDIFIIYSTNCLSEHTIQAENKTTHLVILHKCFSVAFKHIHYVNNICISSGFGQILFIILI